MQFQKVLIDVGEENKTVITEDEEKSSTLCSEEIEDILLRKTLRNENIQGFQKYKFTIEKEETNANNKKVLTITPDPNLFIEFSQKLHGASPINEMQEKLTSQFEPLNSKLFAVVNRNTAHQMGYFLSDFAFKKFGNVLHKKVVINIDQHLDYGLASDVSKFLTWGGNIIENGLNGLNYNDSVSGLTNYSNVTYMVFGICIVDCSKVTSIAFKEKNRINTVKYEKITGEILPINEPFNNFESKKNEINPQIIKFALNKIFRENKSPIDYYITLDTDAFQGSNTCYPSGIIDKQTILTIISEILLNIKSHGNSLVGFDVTGLPIRKGFSTFDFPTYEESYNHIQSIILEIENMLQRF